MTKQYVQFIEHYTDWCFVELKVLNALHTKVMRGYFLSDREENILVHVSTAKFFALCTLNPNDTHFSKHMISRGFFELEPQELDYIQAYQDFIKMMDAYDFIFLDLHGHEVWLHITHLMVREVLSLPHGKRVTFSQDYPQ